MEANTNGNTPTCVGKTFVTSRLERMSRKHPHMRGEDGHGSHCACEHAETPPHAWGRPYGKEPKYERTRNTPTCVGKTDERLRQAFLRKKHPHMRGEDSPRRKAKSASWETPPHAWGRPLRRSLSTCGTKKHPHMRGEDRQEKRGRLGKLGNTPTCVGKTLTTI